MFIASRELIVRSSREFPSPAFPENLTFGQQSVMAVPFPITRAGHPELLTFVG
jgi:hypothetical protein